MNTAMIYNAVKSMEDLYQNELTPWMHKQLDSEKLVNIVQVHSLGCTAAAIAAVCIPDEGIIINWVLMNIFLWSMFFRINHAIGLRISRTFLKTLAAAMLSNLSHNILCLISAIILEAVLPQIPVLGGFISVILGAGLYYVYTVLCGIIYMKSMTKLFSAGEKQSERKDSELKYAAANVIAEEDISSMLNNSRKSATANSN